MRWLTCSAFQLVFLAYCPPAALRGAHALLAAWPQASRASWASLASRGGGAGASGGAEVTPLEALQWNVHGECFRECAGSEDTHCDPKYPACRDGAQRFLTDELLRSRTLDFAGVEAFDDEAFLRGGEGGEELSRRWANLTHACGGEAGYGVFPFDSATLFFDKRKWEPLTAGSGPALRGGCLESAPVAAADADSADAAAQPNYRAFLVQALQHRGTAEKVVVAVAHYPHPGVYGKEIEAFKVAVADVMTASGAHKLVLIADTNAHKPWPVLPIGRSNEQLMKDIYPESEEAVGTDLVVTCCAWEYAFPFDRVIFGGFPSAVVETVLPFGGGRRPSWTALHMHDPVRARMTYSMSSPSEAAGSKLDPGARNTTPPHLVLLVDAAASSG